MTGEHIHRPTSNRPLLEVSGLVKHFPVNGGIFRLRSSERVHAVDGVDFDIRSGETLGLVGESGCGKSTTARLVLRLIEPTAGRVLFNGKDLLSQSAESMRQMRRDMQIVFQDPFGSLDPRKSVAQIIAEPLFVHGVGNRRSRRVRVLELLETVGLPASYADRYPHEFSGGQRQRIGIARALALKPKLVVCDEPVSALDVSIQAQMVNLLQDLQEEFGLTYLFISHDLGVVRHLSDRVAVMYLGKIVEIANCASLYTAPLHPYSQMLLSAVPHLDRVQLARQSIPRGEVPSAINPPTGCRFHPRCPFAEAVCRTEVPPLRAIGQSRLVACHLAKAPEPGVEQSPSESSEQEHRLAKCI